MRKPTYLGTGGDRSKYPQAYVAGRLGAVEKDVAICLTASRLPRRSTPTHAYFPALATCCAFLEHLAALLRGKTKGLGHPDAYAFANCFMRQPDYNAEVVRVLFVGFRNPVAHLGVANGVWMDGTGAAARRLTWKLTADARFPGCEIVTESGTLVLHPPWPCGYTHRVHIHLRRLLIDLRDGASAYAAALTSDPDLRKRFYRVMDGVYPR